MAIYERLFQSRVLEDYSQRFNSSRRVPLLQSQNVALKLHFTLDSYILILYMRTDYADLAPASMQYRAYRR